MAPTPPYRGWTSPAYAFNKRSSQVAAAQAAQVQIRPQSGKLAVTLGTGSNGEGTSLVTFPFTFTEEPVYTYGWALQPNQSPSAGSFPTLSCGVMQWTTSPAGYATLWTGATLCYNVTGDPGQQFLIHYTFTGKAMSGVSAAYNQTGSA